MQIDELLFELRQLYDSAMSFEDDKFAMYVRSCIADILDNWKIENLCYVDATEPDKPGKRNQQFKAIEQIDKLGDFLLKEFSDKIGEGGAVDNAIHLLDKLNSERKFWKSSYLDEKKI